MIDLVKIDIEGGEYDVLPQLIETGLISRIRFLQIQFHRFVDGAVQKRENLREHLRKTHTESWCYPFIWESWEAKGDWPPSSN